jgi:hypothetical protein
MRYLGESPAFRSRSSAYLIQARDRIIPRLRIQLAAAVGWDFAAASGWQACHEAIQAEVER